VHHSDPLPHGQPFQTGQALHAIQRVSRGELDEGAGHHALGRTAAVTAHQRGVPASPFWAASVHSDRRPFLESRRRVQTALRRLFDRGGFIEIDTAVLQRSPGNEAHLHAFATELMAPDGSRAPLYLRTSPEFACKKLLAAGEPRIFEFAHAFRNRERGVLHHPEFTLLEWYRAGARYEAVMEDCAAMLAAGAAAAGTGRLVFRGRVADPRAQPERVCVAEAFARFAGIDLLATLTGDSSDREALAAAARRVGVRIAPDDTWSDIFSRVLVERIAPDLGIGRPTILYEYPVVEAALARRSPRDPRVAERFELYACGVELANGFGELTDAGEQRRRFESEMDEKARVHGERYPLDEDFLSALPHMPEASGVALGFDRLIMLLTGADRIEQVIWTPLG
jgi:elongation factor P--(R)-beta-lysine ligase